MPTCRKCEKPFERKVMIDGREKDLGSGRKFCLDCSPYGLHRPPDFTLLRCKKCDKPFPRRYEENGVVKWLGNGRKFCFDCSPLKSGNNRDLSRTDQMFPVIDGKRYYSDQGKLLLSAKSFWITVNRKKALVEMKGGRCQECGYSKSLRALHFHHRNPEDKEFDLRQGIMAHKPWPVILAEAEKCDLLCANCHSEHHDDSDGQAEKYAEYYERYKDAGF